MAIDRSALRAAYRQEEAACVAERLRQAAPCTRFQLQSRWAFSAPSPITGKGAIIRRPV